MDKLDKRFPKYSRLLGLYPTDYRKEYSRQMLQTLADMLDDKENAKAAVWLRATVDFPFSVTKENLLFMGHSFLNETPSYVKKASFAGSLLILPFFTFLALDALTSHSLYGGWFWHPWVIATWIIIMPALAFLICSLAFVKWSVQRSKIKKIGFLKSLFDWRRNWPMMIVSILSIGIVSLAVGHDSVQCVVNNPVKEIRYWHTTWRCIQNGSF